MNADLLVSPVVSRADRGDFLDLPGRLHSAAGTHGHHVPLLRTEVSGWLTGRGWFPEAITGLLARTAAGEPVGRMIVHHADSLDARLGARTQLFGALEAEDADVVRALIGEAEAHGRERGRTRLFGPVSPLPNVTGGVMTDGFAHPGFFDTVWTPPFLAQALEAEGLSRWGAAHTWEVDIAEVPAALRRPPTAYELEQAGVRFLRPRRRPGWLAHMLRPALNASFAQLPYFTEIGGAQMRAQTSGVELLMDPRLVVLAVEDAGPREDAGGPVTADGRPPRARLADRLAHRFTDRSARPEYLVSFALVLPDPVDVLRAHDGRLGPRAALDLLRSARGASRTAVLIVQGTRPEHQGRGLLSLCVRRLYAALHAGGYDRLRVTFIAEDNPASAAVFARAGGRRLHGLCFFTRDLATGARGTGDTASERLDGPALAGSPEAAHG
ncbi:hypothetical protein [Brevibacterium album]|uniref:hypothetical protein n=1 Tax=Brevibacterium album TaxID=417948 RepID=UPI00040457A9|nr:hypothetical protein [Brevibacterium album]